MITDDLLRVSEAQAITDTAVSTDTIPLSVARDMGAGRPLFMVWTVTTTFDTLTSLTFSIVTDTDEALGSPTTLASKTVTLASGDLAAKKQHILQIPEVMGSLGETYLGAAYTVTGSTGGAGAVTCDIVLDIQDAKIYPAAS